MLVKVKIHLKNKLWSYKTLFFFYSCFFIKVIKKKKGNEFNEKSVIFQVLFQQKKSL